LAGDPGHGALGQISNKGAAARKLSVHQSLDLVTQFSLTWTAFEARFPRRSTQVILYSRAPLQFLGRCKNIVRITSDVIELPIEPGHLVGHRRRSMTILSRPSTLSSAAAVLPWMLNLATRLLARSLNMPEPLLHSTGVFVFAHVQTIENSVGKTLCPVRLLRQLRVWFRQSVR
jgi:hypothetical protein